MGADPVAAIWESSGWLDMDGIAWYRNTFMLTAAQAKAGNRHWRGPHR